MAGLRVLVTGMGGSSARVPRSCSRQRDDVEIVAASTSSRRVGACVVRSSSASILATATGSSRSSPSSRPPPSRTSASTSPTPGWAIGGPWSAPRPAPCTRSEPPPGPASLQRIVVRSGSRSTAAAGRGAPLMPDEEAPLAPTTPYGHSLLEVESVAAGIGRRHDVTVASLRFAPVSGSARAEPARAAPAAARGAGPRVRRPSVLAPRPRRRRPGRRRGPGPWLRRPAQRRRAGGDEPVAGGPLRRADPDPGDRSRVEGRGPPVRGRRRADPAAHARPHEPWAHRRRPAGAATSSSSGAWSRPRRCSPTSTSGRRSPRSRPARGGSHDGDVPLRRVGRVDTGRRPELRDRRRPGARRATRRSRRWCGAIDGPVRRRRVRW